MAKAVNPVYVVYIGHVERTGPPGQALGIVQPEHVGHAFALRRDQRDAAIAIAGFIPLSDLRDENAPVGDLQGGFRALEAGDRGIFLD